MTSGFLNSCRRFADRPALEVQGRRLTYRQLREKAASLAATLQQAPSPDSELTAVFAYRSETAFTGVLAVLLSGHGYVPLNVTFPPERTRLMLQRSACRRLIVDGESERQLPLILEGSLEPLTVILPEREEVASLAASFPQHRFLGAADLQPAGLLTPVPVSVNSPAYVLFTSGSTGIPKGVMVSQQNVLSFVEVMVERYAVTECDRFSQMFDMTFDLSAFDMFVAWERGACLCCPTKKESIMPQKYIRDSQITVWFSVPSTGIFMKTMGMLKPDCYPGLRLSLFCGEGLPSSLVSAWSEAAPNSLIENLYGPTELTIACTLYRWDRQHSHAECENGLVPIGYPYPAMSVLVVNDKLEEVEPGETGELLMSGPQRSLGYWRDPEKTAAAFVVPPGKSELYYRTGDRVRRPLGDRPLIYLGRMDTQIKVLGHRVELAEIESVLREEAGIDTAIALGWPLTESGANGVVGFVKSNGLSSQEIITRAGRRLPDYMVPKQIHLMESFPLNSNGKVDRKELTKYLEMQL
ncbi:amino acid adenylation domain-containing protein [Geomonas sp.]|uniref:amino acid adenylation domain-containing protein n=1 Tax=Geomonas sp. TaxID=2651584 RepID=UPI002B465BBA|nr:amino acid adenylation domain-containing protein [Geomonas sp.]HJV35309.1 amino acid adenylation domain-containing protein [Geomonas sp.]